MNNSFVRKIVYIVIIACLLFPLSMISRPSVKNKSEGGVLARLRTKHNLSQSELSEIDPASETMKLASLGLRGVAVNMLWMQAIDHKKKEEYDKLAATLKSLTKLQPNFVKVWEFQAHNLAYNVSMEFDDYEYRYQWVKRGLDFMKSGVPYNRKDHRMTDSLGFMTGNKFGKSDEKKSFRRMFRMDEPFHISLSDMIDSESYDVDIYGPDSWLLAKQWYRLSNNLVNSGEQKYTNDLMFYMKEPAQIRNRGLSLQNERRTDDVIQDVWIAADKGWQDYGNREIRNSYGVPFQLSSGRVRRREIKRLRDDLDALVPGKREEMLLEMTNEAPISPEQKMLLGIPADQRSDQQQREAEELLERIQQQDEKIDSKIADAASTDKAIVAKRVARKIFEEVSLERVEANDGRNVNYDFWADRNESEVKAVVARQMLYDARQLRRRSIYDDEYDVDYITKEKSNIKKGAISLYMDAFDQWSKIFTEYPDLVDSPLSDEIADEMKQFLLMLNSSNTPWPRDFPLQWLIDQRKSQGEPDNLPTSEDVEELWSGKEEAQ